MKFENRSPLSGGLSGRILSWPAIPPERLLSVMSSGPVVVHAVYQHDDWCRTLVTGRGSDCNCNPTVTYHQQPNASGVG
jgi:hypothetical protein